jgi:HK97 family phage major capsid protein
MEYVAMTDQQGQPIARVNYGINGKAERTLLGREVVIHPYAEEMGALKGAIVDFNDYILNTIYDLGIQKKQDWDTEDLLTKAVMSVDGKMVNTESLIKVTLKSA